MTQGVPRLIMVGSFSAHEGGYFLKLNFGRQQIAGANPGLGEKRAKKGEARSD
jgi:hypothetical protein